MTVRGLLSLLFLSCGLLLSAGCGRGDGGVQIAETDEPIYQEGKQLLRQGRDAEALARFLKVIEQRGERAAPESHFEAGLLYLRHMKDPVSAIYHFKKYVDHPPANAKQVQSVRELINTARREFAATLPGRLLEDQSTRLDQVAELEALKRENQELRAELATLRGNLTATQSRPPRSMLTLDPVMSPAPNTGAPPIHDGNSPAFTPAPSPARRPDDVFQPAPTAPTRGGATTARPPAAPSGRTHTLKPKETLFGISRQYGVRLEELQRANGITDPTKVKEGTVLKIP